MAAKRFKKIHAEGGGVATQYQILQDTETGVNYLFAISGSAAGLTILLDREGRPVITPVERD
ncbi:MAG: DUF6440 family protein [Bacillota bacterium]